MIDKSNHGKVGEALYVKMTLVNFNKLTNNTTEFENLTMLSAELLNSSNFGISTSVPMMIDNDTQGDYEVVCEDGIEIHEENKMERIIRIDEVIDKNGWISGADGYAITTDKQTITLSISNGQGCCENWGYFMSEDNLENFIGANLIDIYITDTSLNTQKTDNISVYEGDIMFVNIQTDRGLLQFVAYNEHNGYYGHEAKVVSEQLNYETYL